MQIHIFVSVILSQDSSQKLFFFLRNLAPIVAYQ